ncbi:MAG: hypothetical protein IPG92_09910 [Flavobacteriales bacterium]|nr:hypothetical protein [Flavobacteriales bacterium]
MSSNWPQQHQRIATEDRERIAGEGVLRSDALPVMAQVFDDPAQYAYELGG